MAAERGCLETLIVLLIEVSQQMAVAQAQSDPNPDIMNQTGLYSKMSQLMQVLATWFNTEPDRMRTYSIGAGRHVDERSAVESKGVQSLPKVNGDKTKFRQWSHKLMTAVGIVNASYTTIIDDMGKKLDSGKPMDDVEASAFMTPGSAKLNQELYSIIIDKAEGEAYDKVKNLKTGEGFQAYMILYKWFTDISGMGLAEQARKLMHPDPPKDESGLAEAIETWTDKVKRLEAHGNTFKMGPVFKMNALKSLMVGKSKEYFELWEVEKNVMYDEESMNDFFDQVLSKVKDYARRKKLDGAVKSNVQQGHDPMDIGHVGNEPEHWHSQSIDLVGGKGKGCWTCGGNDHIARLCPKGKGKGGKAGAKGGQTGACNRCGEFGHWARECPYGKGVSVKGTYGRNEQECSENGKGYSDQSGYNKNDYNKGNHGRNAFNRGYSKGGWKGRGKQVNELDDQSYDDQEDANMGEGEVNEADDDTYEWVQVVKRGKRPKERSFNCVEKKADEKKADKEINEVSKDGQWEKIRVQVDSGAFDWVTPRSTASGIPIKPTEASRKGECFSAANDTDIKTYGEKRIQGFSDEGLGISAKMQVADVKRTLGSVMSMNRTGNKVVLDGANSYIYNRKTGRKIKIYLEGNKFILYMWVKAGHKPKTDTQIGMVHKNRYEVLATNGDEEEDFSWQDELE